MRDMAKIEESIARERMSIPTCNRTKFDAEAKSYLAEMVISDDRRFQQLASKLWERTQLMRQSDLSKAPPLLCRKVNETTAAYLERIYKEGGYCHARG